jgi:putative DNA primase/helicase
MPQVNKALRDRAREVLIEDEIARRAIRLRGNGAERTGPCPRCGGDDRFSINTAKQVFNCRHCGVGGDVIALVQHLDGVDFHATCRTLAGDPGALRPKANGKSHASTVAEEISRATFEYHDEAGTVIFATERIEYWNPDGTAVLKDGKGKKSFRQKRPDPDRPGEWIYNVDGVRVIPYRLPQVIEAIANGHPIVIVEGEPKADLLAEWNVAATCNAGGACKWKSEHSAFLKGADVIIIPDADEAGAKHCEQVGASLHGIAARVRVLMLPGLPPKGDIVDWAKAGGTREQLDQLIEQASEWVPKSTDDKAKATTDEQALIDQLARLEAVDYDRRREAAADQIGVRRGTLDDAVERRRAEQREEQGAPPLFGHWVVEPWPEEVKTDALLLGLTNRLRRHVISSDEAPTVAALWTLFAWVQDEAAVHSPLLLITSAEANSGKTTLLTLLSFLTPRALVCVEIREAVLFRFVEKSLPTIIIDEADTILVNNEALRAVVNSGWTRGAGVPRCIGDDNEPHIFPTFCPKALGMKGRKLPDTTLSRCIIVELKRKRPGEKAEHFRAIDDAELAELRRKARRWAMDNADALKTAEPEMPPGFDNRLGDNWRLLFAIADLAGGEWPKLAREAAQKLSGASDTASRGTRLLAAIKAIIGGAEAIGSETIVNELTADPNGEWHEWRNGRPITQPQLARALKPFGIGPGQVRIGDRQVRGYLRAQFQDAWERYLDPLPPMEPV